MSHPTRMALSKRGYKPAEIVTIGNELTTGLVTDGNSSFIARFLLARGYRVTRITSFPDDHDSIVAGLRESLRRSALVVVTGGLGPTHDDITKNALCELFKCKTRFNAATLKGVQRFFKKAGRPMPAINRSYAYIPTAAGAVANRVGAAPGLFFRKKLLAMPGVPHEARRMLETAAPLIPRGGTHVCETSLHTGGAGEVGLMEKMKSLPLVLELAEVAFLPSYGNVDIRLIARADSPAKARTALKAAEKLIRHDIGEYIWGAAGDTIESVTGNILRKKNMTLAVAESCTGGGIGGRITAVAGSSDYFKGGIVAYANDVKEKPLGVSAATLKKYGAVSAETAAAMARGARRLLKADWGVSATGVAGPGGGTKEKPVGLTFIAVAGPAGVSVKGLNLAGGREANRERTVFEALLLLHGALKG